MVKAPWEETWTALGRTVRMPEHFETEPRTKVVRTVAPFPHAEQAAIAAAAPDLFRAIVALIPGVVDSDGRERPDYREGDRFMSADTKAKLRALGDHGPIERAIAALAKARGET